MACVPDELVDGLAHTPTRGSTTPWMQSQQDRSATRKVGREIVGKKETPSWGEWVVVACFTSWRRASGRVFPRLKTRPFMSRSDCTCHACRRPTVRTPHARLHVRTFVYPIYTCVSRCLVEGRHLFIRQKLQRLPVDRLPLRVHHLEVRTPSDVHFSQSPRHHPGRGRLKRGRDRGPGVPLPL